MKSTENNVAVPLERSFMLRNYKTSSIKSKCHKLLPPIPEQPTTAMPRLSHLAFGNLYLYLVFGILVYWYFVICISYNDEGGNFEDSEDIFPTSILLLLSVIFFSYLQLLSHSYWFDAFV